MHDTIVNILNDNLTGDKNFVLINIEIIQIPPVRCNYLMVLPLDLFKNMCALSRVMVPINQHILE